MPDILVAVGSNLPNGGFSPLEIVRNVPLALRQRGWRVFRQSRCYQTPAWPPESGAPDYINSVVAIGGDDEPSALLADLHAIEAEAGRSRGARYAPRTLDLDLLAWADSVAPDAETVRQRIEATGPLRDAAPDRLLLPHPRLHERAFVLVPLAEVAPGWRHPILGRTARELRDALPTAERAALKPL